MSIQWSMFNLQHSYTEYRMWNITTSSGYSAAPKYVHNQHTRGI